MICRETLQIAVLSLGSFAAGTISLGVLGLAPAISVEFGQAASIGALLVAAYALSSALMAPVLALLWQNGRLQCQARLGLAMLGGGATCGAAVDDINTLLMFRAVSGTGAALLSFSAPAIATALVPPERRGRAISYVVAGLTLAPLIGVPISAYASLVFGWRTASVCMGALAVAALAAFAVVPDVVGRVDDTDGDRRGGLDRFYRVRIARALLRTVGQVAARLAIMGPISGMLTLHYRIDLDLLPIALLAFGAGGVIGNLTGGNLSDRIGGWLVIWASFAGLVLIFSAMLFATRSEAVIGLLAGAGFAGSLFTSAQQVEIINCSSPCSRRIVMALNTTALALGMGGGALLGWVLADSFGYQAVIVSSIAILAVTAFLTAERPPGKSPLSLM